MPRSRFAVTRGDFHTARTLVIVATLALVIGTAARLWPTGPLIFRGQALGQGPAHAPAGLAPGVTARFTPEIEWSFHDPSTGQRLLAAIPALWLLACGLGIAWSVWQLLNAAGRGEPFTRTTLRCARWLAGLVLALAVVHPFLVMGTHFVLIVQVQAHPQVLFFFEGRDFLPVVVGLLLVVLTEVYARGLQLRDDVDGLV